MNLYQINVKHLAQKGSHESIETYMIANNESELYDSLCSFTYWDEKDYERIYEMTEHLLPENFELTIDNLELLDEIWKEFVISTKGELGSTWANFDDLYYGKTYGWELIKENISEEEINVLKNLKIIKP